MKNNKKLIPKLRFPEFQTAGEWEEKKLEELCSIKKGEQKNKLDLIENGKYPVLNGG
ncbi:restriction endonuclease subunit S, partial [uncultured Brachyspira sp.]